jgi:hypothetical protein
MGHDRSNKKQDEIRFGQCSIIAYRMHSVLSHYKLFMSNVPEQPCQIITVITIEKMIERFMMLMED